MIAIQPRTGVALNLKTGLPYVAVAFTVDLGAKRPVFLDAAGTTLPDGVVPLILEPGQNASTARTRESSMIALVVAETPGLAGESVQAHIDRAASATIVATRGVTLASP